MTGPGALAVTGCVLIFIAGLCAAGAEDTYYRSRERWYVALGWLLAVAACACWIGAAWWATS